MTPSAQKLLEDMRKSAANWKRRDLDSLYKGFGFIIRNGSNHDIVSHPKYKQLRTTLPRHRDVLKEYVRIAVKLITRLQELQKGAEDETGSKPGSSEAGKPPVSD